MDQGERSLAFSPCSNGRTEEEGDVTTTVVDEASTGVSEPGQLQVLVLETSRVKVLSLPETGSLRIGRGEECEIRLNDGLVSRHHALLRMSPLSLEDLGSANGTRLGGEAVASRVPTRFAFNEPIVVGRSLLLVRRASGRAHARPVDAGPEAARHSDIVVLDPAMKRLYALVERLAPGQINVLILGETGVGKELVAEAIHRASPRRAGRLVRINCATLSEALLESELFGHERGAFTGAWTAKSGLIELADGGTAFLDEVGELPLAIQAKVLRVLETRETLRVGGLRARHVDVRFVFATNRDLELEVRAGRFRSDLFFRIGGATLEVMPLRRRRAEILPLAEAFLERAAADGQRAVRPTLSDDARSSLLAHTWPGNVRELRNTIERAVLLCTSGTITARDLALEGYASAADSDSAPASDAATVPPPLSGRTERERIARALLACGGNQTRAAESLGMPRRTLVRRIAELGLPRPRRAG